MAPRDGVDHTHLVPPQLPHGQNYLLRRTLSPPEVVLETKKVLKKHAVIIAKRADEHEKFINKIMYSLGVLSFGTFCFLLGSRPQDIPQLYCLFLLVMAPLRWIYYRFKKWHYYLLDFCYYANAIFIIMLLFFPNNEKLFMVCFSFSEGPLAWALIIWRCSLVFSSIDKIVSVLIHLLPGIVFFIIRWWDPVTFPHHSTDDTGPWPAWPVVNSSSSQWIWLFFVPLLAYCIWQGLYFLIVEGLRRQRLLNDPEVMTSYRELKRKAERANNIWWRLSGLLGDKRRVIMYAVLQALFTVATMALTVLLFKSYRLHTFFEILKLSATVWNGGNYIFEVMPRQVVAKTKKTEKVGPVTETNGLAHKSKSDGLMETGKADGLDKIEFLPVTETNALAHDGNMESKRDGLIDTSKADALDKIEFLPVTETNALSQNGNMESKSNGLIETDMLDKIEFCSCFTETASNGTDEGICAVCRRTSIENGAEGFSLPDSTNQATHVE